MTLNPDVGFQGDSALVISRVSPYYHLDVHHNISTNLLQLSIKLAPARPGVWTNKFAGNFSAVE